MVAYRAYSFSCISIWLLTASCVNCKIADLATAPQHRKNLVNSIRLIIMEDFSRYDGDINFYTHYDNTKFPKAKYLFNELLTAVLKDIKFVAWNVHLHQTIYFRRYTHNNLVLVDTFESLSYLYQVVRAVSTQNLSRTIIYISTLHDPNHSELEGVFQFFFDISMLNVGIIIELPNAEVVMVSYFPFERKGGCGIANPVIVNNFTTAQQRWSSRVYFQQKLRNFNRCRLTCAIWEIRPYLWVHRNAAGQPMKFEGIEGKLLQFIGEVLNFTIGLYELNTYELKETFNATGLIFREILKKADFALGGFYYRSDADGIAPFSQSEYYYLSSIFFATNLLSRNSPYENLAFPFSALVWYISAFQLAFACLVIFVASHCLHPKQKYFIIGRNNDTPFLYLFSILAGVCLEASRLPQRNFARFLMTVWLLATLVLRSAYQSGMYQMLRNDLHYHPPQTIASILTQHYEIESSPEYYSLLDNLPEVKQHVTVRKMSQLEAFNALLLEQQNRRAIIVEHEFYGYFRKIYPTKRGLHLVPERIFTQQLSFYVRRNSFLVQVLNEQILRAKKFGLIDKWKRTYVDEEDYGDANAPAVGMEVLALTLFHLRGVFMTVVWAYLFAIGVFAVEIFVAKCKRRMLAKIYQAV